MGKEDLIKSLLSQPQMIQYALQGYELYWCHPHKTFKLYKGTEWGVEPSDIPACQIDGVMQSGCYNTFFMDMRTSELELAIRIMSDDEHKETD